MRVKNNFSCLPQTGYNNFYIQISNIINYKDQKGLLLFLYIPVMVTLFAVINKIPHNYVCSSPSHLKNDRFISLKQCRKHVL